MRDFLTHSTTLWVLFVLFLLETAGFGVIMHLYDFVIIDEMSDPEAVRHHVEEMTGLQRSVHAWMTATLDVAYPLTYGALFAGLTIRVLKPVFAIPAIAVIPTDLVEGFVQVLALNGNYELLWLKAFVTPAKLILFGVAIVIALVALWMGWRQRRSNAA